jgi:hypothetical protein
VELSIPLSGNVADNSPRHHDIPGSVHPLNPVTDLVKTKDAELRGDRTTRITTTTIMKIRCEIPPIISSGARIFLAYILHNNGTARQAQTNNVPCHRWGMYSSLLRVMRPWMTVPIKKAGWVQVAIHAKTVIQPRRRQRKVINVAQSSDYLAASSKRPATTLLEARTCQPIDIALQLWDFCDGSERVQAVVAQVAYTEAISAREAAIANDPIHDRIIP